ncbi:MAG TPA: aminoacyl-tRNA hydrolase [Geobacterales bacterium]|nr:aminoacyl-tRNA hydrolase [Geobacterales bacterium]
MSTILVAGLGNPGPTYRHTRHNVGFMAADYLADKLSLTLGRKAFDGLSGDGDWQGHRLILLKPQTFMNLSGRSVAAACRYHKLSPSGLIVMHDDLDIPFGQVRLKEGGGHGGHNGLRSIMAELGNGSFLRIRIGIGRPAQGETVDYVLSPFSRQEMLQLTLILDGVVQILSQLLVDGVPKAMSLNNNRNFLASAGSDG